jgi:multidrug efflux pump
VTSTCGSASRATDSAAADVRDKVARVRARLPDDIDEPVIAKVEADAFPIIWMAVTAGERTPLEVSDYLARYVKPRLSVLPGAADVWIFGERKTSMRINVDRDRRRLLTTQDIEPADAAEHRTAVRAHRIGEGEFSIVATTDVSTREQFENLIIANSKAIRCGYASLRSWSVRRASA